MPAFHQMGHDSWNLVGEDALSAFRGIVLSPVNNGPDEVVEKLNALGARARQLDIVLDPQFYKPKSDRGSLPQWAHVTSDFETADLGDVGWWEERCRKLLLEGQRVGATSIASPAVIPRTFDPAYYDWVVNCADMLHQKADPQNISTLVTTIVYLPEIGLPGVAERIASIVTRTRVDRVYLVFYDDLQPRVQRTDIDALAGAITLIRALEFAGSRVLVAFSGLDMLLWKSAGATDVATGKFFNLRRFVPGRWDDPAEGGRVLPYWTDDEFATWLREDDVRLLLRIGLIDPTRADANPYSREILALLGTHSGDAWVRLGWRQYMYWFVQRESDMASGITTAQAILTHADRRWAALEQSGAFLFERANNGEWVRAWLNALLLS